MRVNTFLPPSFTKQHGFALIEALIVLTVIGFGFLSLASFQMNVFESADFARHRSEATRLARQKIEQIRSFEQIISESGKVAYNDNAETVAYPVMSASQTLPGPQQELIPTTYLTNASYTRTWWVTQAEEGNMMMLSVEVSWPNRNSQVESVVLQSMLAKADPKESAGIRFPPAGSPVKKPLDRDLNVPVPAVTLSGGKSGFTPPGATGFYYVFDNNSGVVTNVCQGSLPAAAGEGCTDNQTNALVISGYVNFRMGTPCADIGKNCKASSPMDVALIAIPKCADGTSPPGSCSYSNLPGETLPYKCTDNSATAISNPVIYTCIVTTHDRGEGITPRYVWAGQIKLGDTIGTGMIGTDESNYKVCRFSDDYDKSGAIGDINAEHPSIYGLTNTGNTGYMSESLENQNFLVIEGDQACPSSIGYRTVQHQP